VLIDCSVQKGFPYGINGAMEHICSIDSLLANARASKKTLVMPFLNAFGSVCHQYLFDVLQCLKLPDAILSYVAIVAISHFLCLFLQIAGILQCPAFTEKVILFCLI